MDPIKKSIIVMIGLACAMSAAGAARADTCSARASVCMGACTPELVFSGQQFGGTLIGCRNSCQSRLAACMKSGVWVHMGSARRGLREKVDRQ